MTEPLRMLAVHAHPDDESSKGAATIAKYVAEGIEVAVVSCTGGERGDLLNPRLARDSKYHGDLTPIRREEMAKAAEILGIRHYWLGYKDSGFVEDGDFSKLPDDAFARVPVETAMLPLVKIIREYKPQVIVTYDEIGGYPHPDHIQCHRISVAAYEAAANPEIAPELGDPWAVAKLYYVHGFHKRRLVAFDQWLKDKNLESPFTEFLEAADAVPERLLTTQVEVGDYLEIRDRALLAHYSQVDPDGIFFCVPHEAQHEVWPYDDYELRYSRIGVTLPETDLFAGLR